MMRTPPLPPLPKPCVGGTRSGGWTPRHWILTHFRKVSQLREEKPDLAELNPVLRMRYLSCQRTDLIVWRETKNVAIQKLMRGLAMGKGLEVKGNSAEAGKITGCVPFLQIESNKHKYESDNLSTKDKTCVFFVD